MHNEVLYWIVPEGRSPEGRAGSWPETNMPRGVEMAWDYKFGGSMLMGTWCETICVGRERAYVRSCNCIQLLVAFSEPDFRKSLLQEEVKGKKGNGHGGQLTRTCLICSDGPDVVRHGSCVCDIRSGKMWGKAIGLE